MGRRLKRTQGKSKSSPKIPPNAMENSVFPEDIMLCILTRLPVKSILRFKSVCHPWLELFSTPDFIKLHHGQFSSDPKNQSFIVHKINKTFSNTLSLFNLESNEKKPTILDHPFSYIHIEIDLVGCCNGLVCISIPPFSKVIDLWNPAMKLFKEISPLTDCGLHERVSLGLGYDAVGGDFKVVRIVCLEKRRGGESMKANGVEVYSVNSDSWITISVDFQFGVFGTKNDVTVNGNPYWVAMVAENESAKSDLDEVLVRFDVTKLVFEIVPLSALHNEKEAEIGVFDCNGCLGALLFTKKNERVESLYVWIFDDGERIWRKNHTFGPIKVDVHSFLQWSKNGKILGARPDGKLFAFDPETGCVKPLFFGAQPRQSVGVYGYTESLAYIEGMKQVGVRKRTRKMMDD